MIAETNRLFITDNASPIALPVFMLTLKAIAKVNLTELKPKNFFPLFFSLILYPFSLECFFSCQECQGPSFSDCSSCDEEGFFPYFDQGGCVSLCGSFSFAPPGSFRCEGIFLAFNSTETPGKIFNPYSGQNVIAMGFQHPVT